MKSGTGDDPFADDVEEEDTTEEPELEAEPELDTDPEPARGETDSDSEPAGTADSSEADDGDVATSESEAIDSADIPWVLRRSSVKDDRPNLTQFFLRDSTDEAERDFRNEVEQIVNKDVYLLDLREAAYQVAMEHPEEVASVLEEWGYDYL